MVCLCKGRRRRRSGGRRAAERRKGGHGAVTEVEELGQKFAETEKSCGVYCWSRRALKEED